MKVIAKAQSDEFLVKATEKELQHILHACQGRENAEITIGIEIPGHDYAKLTNQFKSFTSSYHMRQLEEEARNLLETIDEIKTIFREGSDE